MPLKDFTVEQVRKEIADIVARYPDRTGGESTNGSKSCVYFKDAAGYIVSSSEHDGVYYDYSPERLVEPVCIIGQWIHDFHPELKTDEDFNMILFRNHILNHSYEAQALLDEEVLDFLVNVQNQQDEIGTTWSHLVF